ncbi:phosphotransferase [Ferruginibacter paludis]|uniref:phosphotransferase n=1 Tax=Ferruginibacter paludis TaxID=1310417 RepID=UPI0025B3637C|nr:phosphotransferase [Ferruginibacter paludis]MDN3656207.1 phosphotransferase [Ferruginibacter paludis]
MVNFSVISSIISPADITDFVKQNYARAPAVTCKLLKTGINHTYRVDSEKESFIFRIYSYNWRTEEEIIEELKLLQLLQQNNIRISYPIADDSGAFIQTIQAPEGARFAVLFSFAKGHKILNFNKETHFEAGKLMAQMHRVTNGLEQRRTNYNTETLLHKPLKKIAAFLAEETTEMQFLRITQSLLKQELFNASTRYMRKGIVHLDIWFDNLNISNHNEITLFDFDFCGNGWLCLDIAYYILQLHSTEKDEKQLTEKLAAFYKGYEAVEMISDEERRLIPYLGVCLYYFYLGVQCSRFDNWSNTFLNEVYLKRFVTILIKGYWEKIK